MLFLMQATAFDLLPSLPTKADFDPTVALLLLVGFLVFFPVVSSRTTVKNSRKD
jgi:hypothetical protein